MLIDLHLHSRESDGLFSVEELLKAAGEQSIGLLALTDHDTVSGVEKARELGWAEGLSLLGGVEISTSINGFGVHILGYGSFPSCSPVGQLLEANRQGRIARAEAMVMKLNGLGIALHVDEVMAEAKGGAVGRPHVARALVKKGVCPHRESAFQRYLKKGRPAFVPYQVPTPHEAVAAIDKAGGKASWAHPLALPLIRRGGVAGLLEELVEAGLWGIEVVHPGQHLGHRKRLAKLARQRSLVQTGGRDFHGVAGEAISLGVDSSDEGLSPELASQLLPLCLPRPQAAPAAV